ncbi:lipopolysaccharide heptosyltransferase I [Anaerohalosphaeraceae bacterium U12dextr]
MAQQTDYRNILIIKPSALGDLVFALPALATLRASFPQARISWLVRNEFAPLLECVRGLDEMVLFDRKLLGQWLYSRQAFAEFRSFLKRLRKSRFDLVVDLQGLFRTAFFAWQTGCPRRFGMSQTREGASLFYTRRVLPPETSIHLVDYYNKIVSEAGAGVVRTDYPIVPPAQAVESVRGKLAAAGLADKSYAVLILGSAHVSKCWPVERFAATARRLAAEYGFAIVAAGSRSEQSLAQAVQQKAQMPMVSLAGQTSIPELVALLKGAGLVLSNDTGPGHIAAAMDVPTVIIFGHTNPARVGPYGKPGWVAAVNAFGRGPAIENHDPAYCITQVTESMVWDAINRVLP